INIYLEMLKEDNEVIRYISKNKDLPLSELIKRLFALFPTVGYGDSQYMNLINKTK
ncbi:AraC family transcriptional regulator, partial [Cytobacillus praedii]